jgi:hypothetical protein
MCPTMCLVMCSMLLTSIIVCKQRRGCKQCVLPCVLPSYHASNHVDPPPLFVYIALRPHFTLERRKHVLPSRPTRAIRRWVSRALSHSNICPFAQFHTRLCVDKQTNRFSVTVLGLTHTLVFNKCNGYARTRARTHTHTHHLANTLCAYRFRYEKDGCALIVKVRLDHSVITNQSERLCVSSCLMQQ